MTRLSMMISMVAAALGFGQASALASHIDKDLQIVASFYPKYLHRNPDNSGLRFWRGELHKGLCVREIEALILASDEYYRVHGCTPHGYIEGVVGDVLGYPICPKEVQHWLHRLQACGCRKTVAMEILNAAAQGPVASTTPNPVVVIPPQPAALQPNSTAYRPAPQSHAPRKDHFFPSPPVSHHPVIRNSGCGISLPIVIPTGGHHRHHHRHKNSGIRFQLRIGF